MLEGEVVQQGLENGELGLEGVEMGRTEGCAVGCVGFRERCAVLKGGEADTATSRHAQMGTVCLYDKSTRKALHCCSMNSLGI